MASKKVKWAVGSAEAWCVERGHEVNKANLDAIRAIGGYDDICDEMDSDDPRFAGYEYRAVLNEKRSKNFEGVQRRSRDGVPPRLVRGIMAELMSETWDEEGGSGGECPGCGAPEGEECSGACKSSHPPGEPDPDRAHERRFEGFDHHFDKFMGRILSEGASRRPQVPTASDSLLRLRAARTQERPLGRIRMGGLR